MIVVAFRMRSFLSAVVSPRQPSTTTDDDDDDDDKDDAAEQDDCSLIN